MDQKDIVECRPPLGALPLSLPLEELGSSGEGAAAKGREGGVMPSGGRGHGSVSSQNFVVVGNDVHFSRGSRNVNLLRDDIPER